MSSTPSGDPEPGARDPGDAADAPAATRRGAISEDWLATITGLVLLALVLAGVLTRAMIP